MTSYPSSPTAHLISFAVSCTVACLCLLVPWFRHRAASVSTRDLFAAETAMGVKIGAQSNSESHYVRALYEVGKTFIYRVVRPWLWIPSLFLMTEAGQRFQGNLQDLHNFTRKVCPQSTISFDHALPSLQKLGSCGSAYEDCKLDRPDCEATCCNRLKCKPSFCLS